MGSLILSSAAVILSIVSLMLSHRTWRETYRPIVTARVKTHAGGNVAILFSLIVENTGNRPAINVRLSVDATTLKAAMPPECTIDPGPINKCFDPHWAIPILANGRETSNYFGKTCEGDECQWVPEARFPVTIRYDDLDGHAYESRVDLFIADTDGFAGSHYSISD